MSEERKSSVVDLTAKIGQQPSSQGRKLCIAVGESVTSNRVKNKKVTWDTFLERLQNPTQTSETFAEYMALPPADQDKIKDVGYFVFGHYNNGIRKKANLHFRDAIVLDLDHCDEDWDFDLPLAFSGMCFAIYSTHKHHPDSPRLRQIIPLTRRVTPDEYEAIARKLATRYDIEVYDKTTFQFSRAMHWPSHAEDGEYVVDSFDGKWLDPQEILDEYTDWRDISEWPRHKDLEGLHVNNENLQVEDPRTKDGWIGAFCRRYSITEALETFLPDTYHWETEDRLSYMGGTTANGAVVYEDLHLYSHHESDPCSGRLVNAFDLVRLHLYGDLDEKSGSNTPVHKLPSQTAMAKYIDENLPEVKTELSQELARQAQVEFEDAPHDGKDLVPTHGDQAETQSETQSEGDEDVSQDGTVVATANISVPLAALPTQPPPDNWQSKLLVDQHGSFKKELANVVLILMYDVTWGQNIRYNEFARAHVVTKSLPQHEVKGAYHLVNGDLFTDRDAIQFKLFLERSYKMPNISKDMIFDAVEIVGSRNKFHPINAYLDALPAWDGTPRLDSLLIDYLGVEDTEYTRTVTRKFLVAAIDRIKNPGEKFDHMLVLEGSQGLGKSRFLKALAKNESWFSEGVGNDLGDRATENMASKWIIEMPEGEGIIGHRNSVDLIKAFLSRTSDRMRPAYGRVSQDFPRQCVFAMTTNRGQYLLDDTGHRRYWPVLCRAKRVDLDAVKRNLDQVWAETLYRWTQGETVYLSPRLETQAQKIQEQRELDDGLVGRIEGWLETPINSEFSTDGRIELRTITCVREVWVSCFNEPESKLSRTWSNRILAALKKVDGWNYRADKVISFPGLGRQRAFVKEGSFDDT